ncbi:MAG: hypothetical protein QM688_00880 [Sphingomonas bacterium]
MRPHPFILIPLALLCGCKARTPRAPEVPEADRIACAHGSAPLARDCSVERAGGMLILRHADGGFRRLAVTDDGHGVAAADGAERAKTTIVGKDLIEVTLGGDRYRLPATVGAAK